MHGRKRMFLLGAAAGAAVAYFSDPQRGRTRRVTARDRTAATARRAGRRAGRAARHATSDAYGLAQRAAHRGHAAPADDVTLTDRVRSEIFVGLDVPSGRINIDAHDGVVFLRGQLDRPDQIRDLAERTGRVAGVRRVENLMHLPGTPAPNLREVQRTG